METILNITKLTKKFGGLTALKDISLKARKGQIVGIIGPNGAGKTTFFNCLTGLYSPSEGEIVFQDKPIVPKFSGEGIVIVQRLAVIFLIVSLLWGPLFWAVFIPKTYFKVELTVLAILLLGLRIIVFTGLRKFQIWAWGLMFVLVPTDIFLAIRCFVHFSELGTFPGTNFALVYFACPWGVAAIPVGTYILYRLLFREDIRRLFGFKTGPDAINRLGIARTFQNIRLFLNLSVLDNVKIGAHGRMRGETWQILAKSAPNRDEERRIERESFKNLDFVKLRGHAFDLAGSLPYGEQRRLEIARALASNPRLLLLDEPAAGMNPRESAMLIDLIREIRARGATILMIEHDMKVMMNLADIIYVLDHGKLIAFGTPDEVRADPKVIEAYLGGGAHA